MLTRPASRWMLYVFASAHFMHDLFTGSWIVVLATQRDALDLSYTEVGIARGVFTVASAVAQPFFGGYFDRTGKPFLAVWAIAITSMMVFLAALAPTYALLLMAGVVGGVGSAIFHAAGLGGAKRLASGRGHGRATAIFLLGGNSGFAIGTWMAGAILDRFPIGALGLPVMILVMAAPILLRYLRPFMSHEVQPPERTTREILFGGRALLMPVVAFLAAVLLVQIYQGGFSTYLLQHHENNGNNLETAGNLTSLYLFFAAVGSFVGGSLSDRFSRRRVAIVAVLITAPLSFLLLRAEGMPLIALSVLLGLVTNIPLPVMLLMGQDVLPGGSSGAGSFAFGITFLAQAIAAPVVGLWADMLTLMQALTITGILPAVAIPLLLLIPERAKVKYATTKPQLGMLFDDTSKLADSLDSQPNTSRAGD